MTRLSALARNFGALLFLSPFVFASTATAQDVSLKQLDKLVYRAIVEICPAVLRGELDLNDPKSTRITGIDPAPASFMAGFKDFGPGVQAAQYLSDGKMLVIIRHPGSPCTVSAAAPSWFNLGGKVRRALAKVFGKPRKFTDEIPSVPHYDLGNYGAAWQFDEVTESTSFTVIVREKSAG